MGCYPSNVPLGKAFNYQCAALPTAPRNQVVIIISNYLGKVKYEKDQKVQKWVFFLNQLFTLGHLAYCQVSPREVYTG